MFIDYGWPKNQIAVAKARLFTTAKIFILECGHDELGSPLSAAEK
jgi:hypothetical protein